MGLQTGRRGDGHHERGSPETVNADLDVAVLQLTSVDDVNANVATVLELLRGLDGAPDLVCLPENSLYMRLREGAVIPGLFLDDPRLDPLRAWCVSRGSSLHLGSVPRPGSGGRVTNTSVLIGADGVARDLYSKIHLFDVDVEGARRVRESDAFAPGSGPVVFEVGGWRIGSSICYDLRFAELYLEYARAGVDLILIPSAFLVATGRAHWDVLTRARAIESQAYVVAAAQGGRHVGSVADAGGGAGAGVGGAGVRETYGHSIIVDPWGEVIDTLPDDFGARRVLRARLSKERIARVRAQIPMAGHRRL